MKLGFKFGVAVVLSCVLPMTLALPSLGVDDTELADESTSAEQLSTEMNSEYGEPVPSVPAQPLPDESTLPADEGTELTELPGAAWVQWDASGSATVDLASSWTPVPGTVLEIRLAPDSAPSLPSDPNELTAVTVSTSKALELGTGVLRFDVSAPDGDAPSSVPPVDIRVSLESAADGFGGAWGESLQVQQATFPAGCLDDLACAALAPVESQMTGPAEEVRFTAEPSGTPAEGSPAQGTEYLQKDESSGTSAAPRAATAADFEPGDITGVVTDSGASYAANPTPSSTKWQVGEGTGEFSYSYPFELPDLVRTGAPGLSLAYSSGSVDAMTLNANSQSGAAGLGWDLTQNYISRSFASCRDDGLPDSGELCWKTRTPGGSDPNFVWDDLSIVLNGQASELVPFDSSGNRFRLRDDPGWRVTRIRDGVGAFNDDNDLEKFTVETPDGTTYWFGRADESKSVWTVPVLGNDAGEPCYQSDGAGVCRQAWRWNLDRVVDAHGNLTTYQYAAETNYYRRGSTRGVANVAYDAAGRLTEVRYGYRATEGTNRARVTVDSVLRCAPTTAQVGLATWSCPTASSANADRYVDTPVQLKCALDVLCNRFGPSFFSTYRYSALTSQTRGSDNVWGSVDRWRLFHSFPAFKSDPHLWLEKVSRTGMSGSETIDLPDVKFGRIMLRNRVLTSATENDILFKPRLSSITTELGGIIKVAYGQEQPCTQETVAGAVRWAPPGDCFAQFYGPSNKFEWFHKYLVKRVGRSDGALGYQATPDTGNGDGTGGSSVLGEWQVSDYEYSNAAGAQRGWRYLDDRNVPTGRESWDDWRGYEKVTIKERKSVKRQLTGVDSIREVVRYRGMSKNPTSLGTGPNPPAGPVVNLHTRENAGTAEPEDLRFMQGRVAEVTVLRQDQAQVPVLTRTYTTYRSFNTADSVNADGRQARMVQPVEEKVTTPLINNDGTARISGGTPVPPRIRTTAWTYVEDAGDPRSVLTGVEKSVHESGNDDAVNTCSETTWRASGSQWLRVPATSRASRGACTNPARVLEAETSTYYDGDAPGTPQALTRGDLTLQRTTLSAGEFGDEKFGYDRFGRVTSFSDAEQNTTTTAYATNPADAVQPVTRITTTDADQKQEVTDYTTSRYLPATVTDANGGTTQLTYDALGRLRTVRRPGNRASDFPDTPSIEYRYQVHPTGAEPMRVATITQRDGTQEDSTYQYYDGWGRLVETQVPTEWRDPFATGLNTGRLVTVTGYDSTGNVAYELPAEPNGLQPGTGLLNPAFSSARRHTVTTYDEINRPTSVTTSYTEQRSDADGGVIGVETPYRYLGDAVITKAPARGWTQTRVNSRGQTTSVTRFKAATTSGEALKADYTYTATGNLKTITSTVAQDCAGCPATRPATWTYTYDLGGRRIQSADPDTGTSTIDYDRVGNPEVSIDGAGRTLATDYDALNRPTTVRDGAQRLLVQNAYGADPQANTVGRLVSSTRHNYFNASTDYPITTSVAGYDDRGNPTGSSWTYPAELLGTGATGTRSIQQSATYYANDTIKQSATSAAEGLPATTVAYAYNSAAQLHSVRSVEDQVALVEGVNYDQLNQPWYMASIRPNNAGNMERWFGWGEGGGQGKLKAMAGQANTPGGSVQGIRDLYYTHDKVGNLTGTWGWERSTDLSTGWCYDYDGYSRLTRAYTTSGTTSRQCNPSGAGLNTRSLSQATYDFGYTYRENQLSNVTANYKAPGTDGETAQVGSAAYAYGDQGHAHAPTMVPDGIAPTSADRKSAVYDAGGAITTLVSGADGASPETFTYDDFGRYATVTRPAGTDRYVYDASGMRVALLTDGPSTDSNVLTFGDLSITNGNASFRVTLPGGVGLGTKSASGWAFEWTDVQGSVRFGSTTSSLTKHEYLPEGAIIDAATWGAGGRGYLGKVHDSAADIQLDHRKYDSLTRTFLNPDPLLAPFEPQTLNPYAYAQYNPTSMSDPSGLFRDDAEGSEGCAYPCDGTYNAPTGDELGAYANDVADGVGDIATSQEGVRDAVATAAGSAVDLAKVTPIVSTYASFLPSGDDVAVSMGGNPDSEASKATRFCVAVCTGIAGGVRAALRKAGERASRQTSSRSMDELVEVGFRSDASHIFRNKAGHFAEDTAENRSLLQSAVNPANLRETVTLRDGASLSKYYMTRSDGTQLWAEVRNGEITNGGLNVIPR